MAFAQNGPFVRYSLGETQNKANKSPPQQKASMIMTQSTFDIEVAVNDLKQKKNQLGELENLQNSINRLQEQTNKGDVTEVQNEISEIINSQKILQEYLNNVLEEREQNKSELANLRGVLANKPSAWREREKKYQYDEQRWNGDKQRFQKKIQGYKEQLSLVQSDSKVLEVQNQLEELRKEVLQKNQVIDKQRAESRKFQDDIKQLSNGRIQQESQINSYKEQIKQQKKTNNENLEKLSQVNTYEHEIKTLKFKVKELDEQNRSQVTQYNVLKQELQKSRSEMQKQDSSGEVVRSASTKAFPSTQVSRKNSFNSESQPQSTNQSPKNQKNKSMKSQASDKDQPSKEKQSAKLFQQDSAFYPYENESNISGVFNNNSINDKENTANKYQHIQRNDSNVSSKSDHSLKKQSTSPKEFNDPFSPLSSKANQTLRVDNSQKLHEQFQLDSNKSDTQSKKDQLRYDISNNVSAQSSPKSQLVTTQLPVSTGIPQVQPQYSPQAQPQPQPQAQAQSSTTLGNRLSKLWSNYNSRNSSLSQISAQPSLRKEESQTTSEIESNLNGLNPQISQASLDFMKKQAPKVTIQAPRQENEEIETKEQGVQVKINNDLWDDVIKELDLRDSQSYVREITQFRKQYQKLTKIFGQVEPKTYVESYKEELKRQKINQTAIYNVIKTRFNISKQDGYVEIDFQPNGMTPDESDQLHAKTRSGEKVLSRQQSDLSLGDEYEYIKTQNKDTALDPNNILKFQNNQQTTSFQNGLYSDLDMSQHSQHQMQQPEVIMEQEQESQLDQVIDLYRYQADNYKKRFEQAKTEKETLDLAFNIMKQQVESQKIISNQSNSQRFLSFFKGNGNVPNAVSTKENTLITKLNARNSQLNQELDFIKGQLNNSQKQIKLMSTTFTPNQFENINI